jgi:hypothetical protein
VSHTVSSRDEPNWNETEVGGDSRGEVRFENREGEKGDATAHAFTFKAQNPTKFDN